MSQGNGLEEGNFPSGPQFLRVAVGEPAAPDPPPFIFTQAKFTDPYYVLCAGSGSAPAQACLSLQDTVGASV